MSEINKILDLTAEEIRILGVLLEKEKTTPDNYPLTLNSIIAACNQTTNRHPIVKYDEMIVERGLTALRERGLALRGVYAGSRVPKHRHHIENVFNISKEAQSLLCVLMLRGPQTLGELKTRTERMCDFATLQDCDNTIEELVSFTPQLAVRNQKQPGQKESRINHNFNNAHNEETDEYVKPSFQLIEGEGLNDENEINDLDPEDSVSVFLRIDYLESEVAILTHELMALRAEVDAMRDPLPNMDNSRRIYKSNRRVRVGDCNSKGKLRLDAIACYLQDVGFDDTNDLGLGDGGIWVARAIEITNKTESEELWPSRNDDVQIETYCGGAGRVSAQRNVNIFLKNKLAIETKTVWVSLDGNFKPCSIPKWLNEKYPNTQKISSKRTLSFSPTEDEKTNGNSFVFKVRSSDIDINNHANNAFAFDVLNEASILCGVETFSRANVEYHKPIGFKDELKVYVSKSDTEFKAWVYTQDNIACSMLWVN